MLMRTASCGRCVLHDTWHDLHDALRRVQLARPAYSAFSSETAAICAQSSAMPAGLLSSMLGVSTAAPTGEIALSGNAQVEVYGREGTSDWEWGKVETGESGNEALAGMDLSGIEA